MGVHSWLDRRTCSSVEQVLNTPQHDHGRHGVSFALQKHSPSGRGPALNRIRLQKRSRSTRLLYLENNPIVMAVLRLFVVSLLASLLLGGCAPGSEREPEPVPTPAITTANGPDWSYEGTTGPSHWADLSTKYEACDGDRQSPIALTEAETATEPSFRTLYVHDRGTVIDTGHSLQVNTTGGMLTVDNTVYDLREFHIHVPSEHTVNGQTYAAELHFVYKASSGDQLAVHSIFVEEGTTPHPSMKIWELEADTTVTLNVGRMRPREQSYFTYEGSLTTPPCSETVRWFVMDTPIQASSEQLAALRARYNDNARPVQPLGNRTLTHVTP